MTTLSFPRPEFAHTESHLVDAIYEAFEGDVNVGIGNPMRVGIFCDHRTPGQIYNGYARAVDLLVEKASGSWV